MATPVNPENRMEEIGRPRMIEVLWFIYLWPQPPEPLEQGWTRFNFPGRGGKVGPLTPYPCRKLNPVRMIVQYTEMDPRAFHGCVEPTISGESQSRTNPLRY